MAYLKRITIDGNASDVKEYRGGDNVTITSDGVISATDTTYTAGAGIDITNGVITATGGELLAGDNIDITNGVISATDTTYSAGANIDITGTTISAPLPNYYNKSEVDNLLTAAGGNAVVNVTRNGTTFTATRANGTTFTFDQQDNDTWVSNTASRAGYVASPASGAWKIWETNASGTPAWRDNTGITNITRSGTTFTATRANGETFTFTQQDNNTWTANSATDAGYVASPNSGAWKIWETNASGVPAWRDNTAVTGITRSGTTFTATRANGTTFTFTQQDTTYSAATASANGLMTAQQFRILDRLGDRVYLTKSSDQNITANNAWTNLTSLAQNSNDNTDLYEVNASAGIHFLKAGKYILRAHVGVQLGSTSGMGYYSLGFRSRNGTDGTWGRLYNSEQHVYETQTGDPVQSDIFLEAYIGADTYVTVGLYRPASASFTSQALATWFRLSAMAIHVPGA